MTTVRDWWLSMKPRYKRDTEWPGPLKKRKPTMKKMGKNTAKDMKAMDKGQKEVAMKSKGGMVKKAKGGKC